MKVSFGSGFIKFSNSDKYINPNQITYMFKRTDGNTSIHFTDGDYAVTPSSSDKIADACIKAQAENMIVRLNEEVAFKNY